jgi:hypothetical protein
MAALTQPVTQPNTRLTRERLALLAGASLIAPVLLVSQTLLARDRVDGLAIGAASMLLFLLAVLRIVGLSARSRSSPIGSPRWPATTG